MRLTRVQVPVRSTEIRARLYIVAKHISHKLGPSLYRAKRAVLIILSGRGKLVNAARCASAPPGDAQSGPHFLSPGPDRCLGLGRERPPRIIRTRQSERQLAEGRREWARSADSLIR
jgi:hypothetical protein